MYAYIFYVTLLTYFRAPDKILERFQSFVRFNADLEIYIVYNILGTPMKYLKSLIYLGSIYAFMYLL